MFRIPCGPEIHACALPTQHKLDFQHGTFLLYILKFCVENFHNLDKSMSYASISHVGELSGQNRCASGTRNIESNTHGLMDHFQRMILSSGFDNFENFEHFPCHFLGRQKLPSAIAEINQPTEEWSILVLGLHFRLEVFRVDFHNESINWLLTFFRKRYTF
jgi:hypothetical protein